MQGRFKLVFQDNQTETTWNTIWQNYTENNNIYLYLLTKWKKNKLWDKSKSLCSGSHQLLKLIFLFTDKILFKKGTKYMIYPNNGNKDEC